MIAINYQRKHVLMRIKVADVKNSVNMYISRINVFI